MKYRRYLHVLTVFILAFFFTACQNTTEQQQGMAPKQMNNLPHNDSTFEQPQLEGGSEKDVRKPHPVSNSVLQKEFPDILALHGRPDINQVALSFDDGPDIRFTPQVLDVLAKHGVKATFFLMGSRAKAHPDIVKRIHDEGHAIGNHTYWHPNLANENLERLQWELQETDKVINEIVGFKPRLFRAPYGFLNRDIIKVLGEVNYSVIGWDVDSLDWKQPGAEIVTDNVLSNVKFGSIILMHDGSDWSVDLSGTVEAVDEIIKKLKEDDTKFVTIPELIGVSEAK